MGGDGRSDPLFLGPSLERPRLPVTTPALAVRLVPRREEPLLAGTGGGDAPGCDPRGERGRGRPEDRCAQRQPSCDTSSCHVPPSERQAASIGSVVSEYSGPMRVRMGLWASPSKTDSIELGMMSPRKRGPDTRTNTTLSPEWRRSSSSAPPARLSGLDLPPSP